MIRTLSLACALSLFGVAEAEDKHHGGHQAIKGKPNGQHAVHATKAGHTAHAHIENGKVKHLSVAHPKGKQVAVQKVKTARRLHAMIDGSSDTHLVMANAEANELFVWIGFRFFDDYSNCWVYIWFPAELIIGGDQGAFDLDGAI